MIRNRADYEFYLEADKLSLGITRRRPPLFNQDIWKFQRLLRKIEYLKNYSQNVMVNPYYYMLYYHFHQLSLRLGFTIPPNVFGPGLSIAHIGTIIVNSTASVGENCRIHCCVYIATGAGESDKTPKIGDNVYIGPGAKIFGDIEIADGIAVGANAVVNKSFLEPNITIAGVPARKISDKGSDNLLIKGTELVLRNR